MAASCRQPQQQLAAVGVGNIWFDVFGVSLVLRLLAKGAATCDPKIQVCVTRGHEIWLQNTTDTDREVKAGELFGLGLANATETPIGWILTVSVSCAHVCFKLSSC